MRRAISKIENIIQWRWRIARNIKYKAPVCIFSYKQIQMHQPGAGTGERCSCQAPWFPTAVKTGREKGRVWNKWHWYHLSRKENNYINIFLPPGFLLRFLLHSLGLYHLTIDCDLCDHSDHFGKLPCLLASLRWGNGKYQQEMGDFGTLISLIILGGPHSGWAPSSGAESCLPRPQLMSGGPPLPPRSHGHLWQSWSLLVPFGFCLSFS